jgi:DnaK suppressor protein
MTDKTRDNDREQRNLLEKRNLLTEQKRKLWTELREDIFANNAEAMNSQYDIPQDIGDMGMLDLLSDAGLAIADIRRQQIADLEEALRRLEMGTYGRCEGCGEPIDMNRLRLVPFTSFCLPCQKEQEGPSRPPGVTM